MTKPNARVVVYGARDCEYSRSAAALLHRQRVPFDAVDVTDDPDKRAELAKRADGRTTTPVIFIDGKPIGGFQELSALASAGKLDDLARAA